MGTTKIAWMQKDRDGFAFREDFECDAFVSNEQWLIVQGVPDYTPDLAASGSFSLPLAGSQDSSGFPLILKRTVADTYLATGFFATVWYYDTMDAVLPGPFFKVSTDSGKFFQVGVRNAISTTKYVCNPSGNYSEDSFSASSVSRSLGWHKLQVRVEPTTLSGKQFWIYIDDTTVLSGTFNGSGNMYPTVNLCAATVGVVTDSFGNFDDLRVQYSAYAYIRGYNNHRVIVSGGLLDSYITGQNALTFTPPVQLAKNSNDLTVSQWSDHTKPLIYWFSREFNGGDIYTIFEVDFGRKATVFQSTENALSSYNTSVNGRTETIKPGRSKSLLFTVRALDGDQWRKLEYNFFDYASAGNPFSLLVDSDDAVYTRAYPQGFMTSNDIFTVDPVLGQTYAGITVNNYYAFEKQDRSREMMAQITLIANGSVYPGDIPTNVFSAGDTIRSPRFFPMMMLDPAGKKSGISYTDIKVLRQDWTANMVEYIP